MTADSHWGLTRTFGPLVNSATNEAILAPNEQIITECICLRQTHSKDIS